jgi:hypothetical protein
LPRNKWLNRTTNIPFALAVDVQSVGLEQKIKRMTGEIFTTDAQIVSTHGGSKARTVNTPKTTGGGE